MEIRMRKLSLGLLVLALLSPISRPNLLLAQTPPKEATATIAGIITLNGEPARGVSVALQLQSPSTPLRPSPPAAKTDATGRFRITGVAAGQYIVGALAPGYVTDGKQGPVQGFGLQGKIVYLTAGETVENVELALKRGSVVTGRITDSNGEPVAETTVRLSRVLGNGLSGPPPQTVNGNMYRTDDRGVYRIYGLPAGKYKVSVGISTRERYFNAQNSRTFLPETFHPDTTDESMARVIELEDGQEATDVDIKAAAAQRAYEISGRVVDAATGKPLAGLGIAYGTYSKEGRLLGGGSGNWRSNANGEFHIIGVLPGKFGVLLENREGKSELYSEPTPVEVTDSDVTGVEVRAQPGASISGTVIIEGTSDPAVLAKRALTRLDILANPFSIYGQAQNTRVNADGSFSFRGVPAGKFRFSAFFLQPKISLLRIERNGTPLADSSLDLRSGDQITGVRIVFGYGNAVVRGQIKIVGGTLPEGVRLTANLRQINNSSVTNQSAPVAVILGQPNNSSAINQSAPIDDRGQFIVRDLIPGTYELSLGYSFTFERPVTKEAMAKVFAISKVKQTVTATNGAEAQVTLTLDLSQENDK